MPENAADLVAILVLTPFDYRAQRLGPPEHAGADARRSADHPCQFCGLYCSGQSAGRRGQPTIRVRSGCKPGVAATGETFFALTARLWGLCAVL